MMNQPKIIVSRLRTPDGTILHSRHRHDYVTHVDANGRTYILDGGSEYIRHSANGDEELLTVYSNSPHSEKREYATWGTYGIHGRSAIRYVPIKDLSEDHILNIIRDCRLSPEYLQMLNDELVFRSAL